MLECRTGSFDFPPPPEKRTPARKSTIHKLDLWVDGRNESSPRGLPFFSVSRAPGPLRGSFCPWSRSVEAILAYKAPRRQTVLSPDKWALSSLVGTACPRPLAPGIPLVILLPFLTSFSPLRTPPLFHTLGPDDPQKDLPLPWFRSLLTFYSRLPGRELNSQKTPPPPPPQQPPQTTSTAVVFSSVSALSFSLFLSLMS